MLKYLLKEMRVHHYIKNFLVYAALVCSGKFFDAEKLMPATLIFVAFCFTSSIVYMINDIKDVEKDRNHPTKCKRPIAAGNISISLAIFVSVVLFVVATVCCIASRSLMASFLLFLYLCLNVAYSMGLKNVPILDVSILVSGFLLRLICGAVAADIVVSNWLYLTVISLAFYLALGKRRNELKKTAGNTRSVLKKYPESFLDKNMYLFLALAIVFYALWSVDPVTIGFYGLAAKGLVWTVPILCLITLRYTYDLARLLVDMNETEKYGYYHATNEGGYISWYDFTKEIYRQAGYKTAVLPVSTEEYGLSKAARPFNSRLDKSKLVEAGFTPLPTWQDALSRYLKEIEQ